SDVVIGGSRSGQPWLFLGSPSGLSTSPSLQSGFLGRMAVNAGDVNGDHIDDLIVGDFGYSNGQSGEGAARIYLGGPALPSTTPFWQVELNQQDAGRGISVAGAGDTDGD